MKRHQTDNGTSIMEVMVMLLIASVLGLGLSYSLIVSHRAENKSRYHSAAMQLATEKLEALKSVNPASLSSSSNQTENNVAFGPMSFKRVSSITVNSDRSRTVTITVTSNSDAVPVQASVSDTFALWGSV